MDNWEFSNRGFIKGQRHLLRNIRRRKPPSQHAGTSSSTSGEESGKASLENEIEQLRKERTFMMQEVSELQNQQKNTVQHMEAVHEKLEEAEKRQKQMVSFLGKMFQNPAFMSRLRQMREEKRITYPRMTRKFIKHPARELGSSSDPNPQKVAYQQEHSNLTAAPGDFSQNIEQNLILGSQHPPFQVEDIGIDELAMIENFIGTSEQTLISPSQTTLDQVLKGKGVMDPQLQSNPEHFISYPEDLAKEKSVPADFSVSESEHIIATEAMWNFGSIEAGMSSSTPELWSNSSYDLPELGGLSDIWDIGTTEQAGSSSVEKRSNEDSPS